jgi:hypothetical protein
MKSTRTETSFMWLGIGLGIISLTIVVVASRAWRIGEDADLGTVSDQWLAEHRNHTR